MTKSLEELNGQAVKQKIFSGSEYFVCYMQHSHDIRRLPALNYGLSNQGNWYLITYFTVCPDLDGYDEFLEFIQQEEHIFECKITPCENPISHFLK